MTKVLLYDTTLRDGAQTEGVTFSLEDKLKVVQKLDEIGIPYIEGGYPGSNPKDRRFFDAVRKEKLKISRIAAFGMTRRPHQKTAEDEGLLGLLHTEAKVVTVVGKSWDFHVKQVLKTSGDENLKMIKESIAFLKRAGREVIFDAEHFFDGYKRNPRYALSTLQAAVEGGADWLVLCDTNGGALVKEVEQAVQQVRKKFSAPLGIHAHNDGELAVANSLAAVEAGVRQVQGTINGLGERCGNANLVSVACNLMLKMGYEVLPESALVHLKSTSRYISEIANILPQENQPFVGERAFVHKGGMHVHAVMAHPETYEHIRPELVGNQRRVLVSELSGKSNILYKVEELGLGELGGEAIRNILEAVKEKENAGFQFDAADGSLWLLMQRHVAPQPLFFALEGFRLVVEKQQEAPAYSEATIKVQIGEKIEHTAAEGDGPVNALDNALRKALEPYYPKLKAMHLTDFKVRVLDAKEGTAAKVRVLIETRGKDSSWTTIGVSENIIEASWQALTDSIDYGLLWEEKRRLRKRSPLRAKSG